MQIETVEHTGGAETHLVAIPFRRIGSVDELLNVLNANGSDNLVRIFEKENILSPLTYFTFSNKKEFYVVETSALPVQKSLAESASEAVVEKYNDLQNTLTGALKSDAVDEIKNKASETFTWAKGLLKK